MHINHIAIWTNKLEALKSFYCHYFLLIASDKYSNPQKSFASYFLSGSTGAKVELMTRTDHSLSQSTLTNVTGLAHIAFSVGSESQVQALTQKLVLDGYTVTSEPRKTGDGFYESCIKDPDGNLIEITV